MDIDESREKPSKKEIGFLVFFPVFQEEVWPLLPIITTASLSTTQKHFNWAVQVLLAYKEHLQVD